MQPSIHHIDGQAARIAFKGAQEIFRVLNEFVIFIAKRTKPTQTASLYRERFFVYLKAIDLCASL